jgi:hypothetical protein
MDKQTHAGDTALTAEIASNGRPLTAVVEALAIYANV